MRYGADHEVKSGKNFSKAIWTIQVDQLKIAGALSSPPPTSDLPPGFAQATCHKTPQDTLRTDHKNTTGLMHQSPYKSPGNYSYTKNSADRGFALGAAFKTSAGCPCWLQFSRSKADDFMAGSVLNGTQVGTDRREIASELARVLHPVFAHFLNDRVFHWSTSNSSSGEQISGHAYP